MMSILWFSFNLSRISLELANPIKGILAISAGFYNFFSLSGGTNVRNNHSVIANIQYLLYHSADRLAGVGGDAN